MDWPKGNSCPSFPGRTHAVTSGRPENQLRWFGLPLPLRRFAPPDHLEVPALIHNRHGCYISDMNPREDPRAHAIMGCAMRVHRTLGFGFLESACGRRASRMRSCSTSEGPSCSTTRSTWTTCRRRPSSPPSRTPRQSPWEANLKRAAQDIRRSGNAPKRSEGQVPKARRSRPQGPAREHNGSELNPPGECGRLHRTVNPR